MYHLHGVAPPTLHAFLDASSLVGFISFLRARGVDKSAILNPIYVATRVATSLGGSAALVCWLDSMKRQLQSNMQAKPRLTDPEHLQAAGKWLPAADIQARVEAIVHKAKQALAECDARRLSRREAAALVHDALLACFFFGYLPPLRPSCVLATVGPHYQGPCTHPDCQHPSLCAGNRVLAARGAAPGQWQLVFSHHKNSGKWGGQPIKMPFPQPIALLMTQHLQWGLGQVSGAAAAARGAGASGSGSPPPPPAALPPTLFFNLSTCQPLKPGEVAGAWAKVVLVGTGVRLGPQRLRSIFVTEVRGAAAAAGAGAGAGQERELAFLMGNSLREWDNTYDRLFAARQGQQAVNQVAEWGALARAQRAERMQSHGSNTVLAQLGVLLKEKHGGTIQALKKQKQ